MIATTYTPPESAPDPLRLELIYCGEGTGLGLSITHDIIVKQHSGSIEVDSQPGEYTEVRIVLPRMAAFITDSRGRA